ncbi:unnamed protein product, partial [Symbiodinium sp. KB8]
MEQLMRDLQAQQAELLAEVRRLSLAISCGGVRGNANGGSSPEYRFFTSLADSIVRGLHSPRNRYAMRLNPARDACITVPPRFQRDSLDCGMSVRVVVKGHFDGNLWHQQCGSGRHIRGDPSDAAWLLTAVTETLADSLRYLDRGGLEHFRRVPPVTLETVTAIDVEEEVSGEVTLLVSVKLVAPPLASGSNENGAMEVKENEEGKERREAAAGCIGE